MFFPSSESVQTILCLNLPSINVLWCFAASIFGLQSIIPSIAPPTHQKSLIHLSECLQYVSLIYPFCFSVFFSMFFNMFFSMLLFYFLLLSFLMHSFTILNTFHFFFFQLCAFVPHLRHMLRWVFSTQSDSAPITNTLIYVNTSIMCTSNYVKHQSSFRRTRWREFCAKKNNQRVPL